MAGYEHTLTQGLILLTTSGYDPLGVEKDYLAEGPSDGLKAQVMG